MQLRMHTIIRSGKVPGYRHEFTVAQVIERLNAGNAFAKIWMGPRDVRRQLFLPIRRSSDQNSARLHDCLGNALQKHLVYRRVTTATGIFCYF
jgi:hypothetical protein